MGNHTENTVQGEVAFALDALREAVGLSVPELAVRADMDAAHLWQLVNGAPMTPAEAARLGMEMAFVLMSQSQDEELFVA